VKRRELIRHLAAHGCRLVREGANHSWWENPVLNRRSAVPRHTEVNRFLARKICRDLGITEP
jgi:mRNA interferase HicA